MFSKAINRFEESVIALLLAGMVIVTFSQVIARYVFNSGAVWALELTTYLFAWLVLFGMSYGVKVGAHLGVDAFVRLFPKPGQRALTITAALCCVAYGVILLIGASEYISKIYRFGIEAEDLPIPRWIPYSILPIGLVLLIIRFVEATYLIIIGKRETLSAGHEVEDAVKEVREAALQDSSKS